MLRQWEIGAETVESFKSAKVGDEFKSPEFTIGPALKWYLSAHPNGMDEEHKNQCSVRLVLSSSPDHLSNIVLSSQLHCDQLGSDCSSIESFRSIGDASNSYKSIILRSELLESSSMQCPEYYEDILAALTIQCSITILQIQCFENVLYSHPLNVDLKSASPFVLKWN